MCAVCGVRCVRCAVCGVRCAVCGVRWCTVCKKRWQGCLECVLCLVVVLCRASCVRVASPVLRCLQFLLLLHSRPFFRALTFSRLLSSTPHPLSPPRCIAQIYIRSSIQCQPLMWMQISSKARVLESPGTRLHRSRSTALLFLAFFLAGLSITLNYFSLIFVTAGTWERRSHRITTIVQSLFLSCIPVV